MKIREDKRRMILAVFIILVFFVATLIIWTIGENPEIAISFGVITISVSGAFLFLQDRKHQNKQPIVRKKAGQNIHADYINQSVEYSIRRLGDETYSPASPPEYEIGNFVINGKHLTLGDFAFSADDIQWFGRYNKSSSVRLSLNIDGWWYRLSINPVSDEDNFYDELLKHIPEKLKLSRYKNRPDISSGQGTMANIAHQNLHGIFEDHEAVELYVTPLWLVVLHNGTVIEQHRIDDISDIRSTKHPMHINDDMQLLSFEIGDKALMFSHMDSCFVIRLSDASRSGFDSSAMRKKKQADESLN